MKRQLFKAFTIVYSLVFLVQGTASSQDLPNYISNVQHFSIEQGLFNRHVNCFQEDDSGFMWIGTQNGLHRFDGYGFELFTKEKDSLASNQISQLAKDTEGNIWVFYAAHPNYSPTQIDIISGSNSMIKPWGSFLEETPPMEIADIIKVYPQPEGEIIFTTKSGALYRYTNQFEKVFQIDEKDHVITEVIPGAGNTFWVKSSENILREINSQGRVLQKTKLPDYANTLLAADLKNRVLIQNHAANKDLFYNLLALVNPGEKISPISLRGFDLPIATNDFFLGPMAFNPKQNLLWCAGNGAIFTLHLEHGLAYDFIANYPSLEEIGSVTFIHTDRRDNIWIAGSNGFLVIQLKENKFTPYLHQQKGIFDQLHSTRAMMSDNEGGLIVNSYGGASVIDLASSESRYLEISGKPTDYHLTNFISMLRDRSGALWYGSGYDMLVYTRGSETRWYRLREFVEAQDLAIWSMYEDEQEIIWLGTNRGLYQVNPARDSIIKNDIPYAIKQLDESQILHFYEESPSKVWLCTTTGLYNWNPLENVFTNYSTKDSLKNYLPFDIISHMTKDAENSYWLSTKGGGLIHWNPLTQESKQYTIANGLSHNVLYAVYQDRQDGLWLPSDKGLMRFDKNNETVNIYFPRDGITHEEFNTNSHYQGEDGRIYFGGLNGVTAFYPESVLQDQNNTLEKVAISSFGLYDADIGDFVDRTNDLVQNNQIVLSPKNKSFILSVSLLDFIKPEKHIYAYKIEGLDENWVFQNRNDIRINGLPYGNYELKIKAQGSNGQWSSGAFVLPITVEKPFYLQPWFIALCAAIFALLVFAILRWRTFKLRVERKLLEVEVNKRTETIQRQAEKLKQIDQQKSRFFANVSHELRTPLTLILGPISRMLKRDYLKDEDIASLLLIQKNAKQLLNQVNEILDLSKLESSEIVLEEKTTELVSFIKKTVASFDSYATNQGLNLTLLYQGEEPDFIYMDQRKVEKIIHNLLSNAIKFTPRGGQIEVRVYNWNNSIQVKVIDSGKGIKEEDLSKIFERYFQSDDPESYVGGTGIGLALANELAKLLKGSIQVSSTLGKGSTFTFEFPKKVAKPEFSILAEGEENYLTASTNTDEGAVPHETAFSNNKATILVVEDNPDMRNYIKSVLSTRYKVLMAENGQVALKHLAESSPGGRSKGLIPDLILSDVMMPVMDGLSLLNKVKSSDQWRGIPMVMLTARGEQRNKLQALRIGVDDYLIKPFDEEELLIRIHNLLDNYEKRKRWSEETVEVEQEAIDKETTPKKILPSDYSSKPIVSKDDQEWLKRLEHVSKKFIGDTTFGIERLSDEMALSPRQLFRKVRQLTGMTPKKYIQELRFQKARQLLETKTYSSVKAVSFAIGMKDVKYFSQRFKARFGKHPSSYL